MLEEAAACHTSVAQCRDVDGAVLVGDAAFISIVLDSRAADGCGCWGWAQVITGLAVGGANASTAGSDSRNKHSVGSLRSWLARSRARADGLDAIDVGWVVDGGGGAGSSCGGGGGGLHGRARGVRVPAEVDHGVWLQGNLCAWRQVKAGNWVDLGGECHGVLCAVKRWQGRYCHAHRSACGARDSDRPHLRINPLAVCGRGPARFRDGRVRLPPFDGGSRRGDRRRFSGERGIAADKVAVKLWALCLVVSCRDMGRGV